MSFIDVCAVSCQLLGLPLRLNYVVQLIQVVQILQILQIILIDAQQCEGGAVCVCVCVRARTE